MSTELAFNSLSRDHLQSRADERGARGRDHFQLPLSGSLRFVVDHQLVFAKTFNSLSRDHL